MRTRGCGCAWHPAFPTPSILRAKDLAQLGRNAPRGGEGVFTVIARSVSDEAIQLSLRGKMDCFASLAMTESNLRTRNIFSRRSDVGSLSRSHFWHFGHQNVDRPFWV